MKLDGEDLPNTMRYPPFVQEKRYSIEKTAGGAVFQEADGLVQGDGILDWTMEALCFRELCDMYRLYRKPGPLVFDGQYGEQLLVEFVKLTPTAQGGGNFQITGQFIVRCVIADICEGE